MRAWWIVLVACGPSHVDAPRPKLPPDAGIQDGDTGSAAKPPPIGNLVVLDFVGDPKLEVTDWFRDEAATGRVVLSGERHAATDEQLLHDCTEPPHGDATCMAKVGRELGATYLLWGVVQGSDCEAQLVVVDHPSASTSQSFHVTGRESVRDAWAKLHP